MKSIVLIFSMSERKFKLLTTIQEIEDIVEATEGSLRTKHNQLAVNFLALHDENQELKSRINTLILDSDENFQRAEQFENEAVQSRSTNAFYLKQIQELAEDRNMLAQLLEQAKQELEETKRQCNELVERAGKKTAEAKSNLDQLKQSIFELINK